MLGQAYKKKVTQIKDTQSLSYDDFLFLYTENDKDNLEFLFNTARGVCDSYYGKDIYIRGLIEFTNYCKNDCFYCGIRKSNASLLRYRLTEDEILSCAKKGYDLGFRTFVLQGGEDEYFTDDVICNVIQKIKIEFPLSAITLSIGEKSFESYKKYFDAGAERYLLRQESANEEHYKKLHPNTQSLKNRIACLRALKKIGYQVGCGFMVGSPFQSTQCIYEDLMFIHSLQPAMIGIGPFIPHHSTPFRGKKAGDITDVLKILSIIRLIIPKVLLPSTTALATISPDGRERGILAGANVVMPNLSPLDVRNKYLLYDNKACIESESAECLNCLKLRLKSIGYNIAIDRGDSKNFTPAA